jgi:hypothetical protein
MALFKKLNEQMDIVKNKKEISISLAERDLIETELIFGNIFEDVYKVTAIGQGGTETSYEYERASAEDAKKAGIDGFDVPEKNILKVEKMDHDKPQNPKPNVDQGPLSEGLITPTSAEDKNDFISRFMSDELSKKEFPENKQRLAVAYSQ